MEQAGGIVVKHDGLEERLVQQPPCQGPPAKASSSGSTMQLVEGMGAQRVGRTSGERGK